MEAIDRPIFTWHIVPSINHGWQNLTIAEKELVLLTAIRFRWYIAALNSIAGKVIFSLEFNPR